MLLNQRFRFIQGLRRRLHLNHRSSLPIYAVAVPMALEVAANLTIAFVFKVWPGYKMTLNATDLLLTLGFMRPRAERFVSTTIFLINAHNFQPQRPHPETRPMLRPSTPATLPSSTTLEGMTKGRLHFAGETMILFFTQNLARLIFEKGRERGYYKPEVRARLPSHVKVLYDSAWLTSAFCVAVFALMWWDERYHTFSPRAGAEGSAGAAAIKGLDGRAAGVRGREEDEGNGDDAAVEVVTPRRPLGEVLSVMAILIFDLAASLTSFSFWSGVIYSTKGR